MKSLKPYYEKQIALATSKRDNTTNLREYQMHDKAIKHFTDLLNKPTTCKVIEE